MIPSFGKIHLPGKYQFFSVFVLFFGNSNKIIAFWVKPIWLKIEIFLILLRSLLTQLQYFCDNILIILMTHHFHSYIL
jgi:hypothetical protein